MSMQDLKRRGHSARTLLFVLAAAMSLIGPGARAQRTAPTASRRADLQLGGSFMLAHSDYGQRLLGEGFYGTYDFHPHFGVEASIHQLNSQNGDKRYERTYEIGGRYVYHLGRLNPYAHVMYGRGVFNFPQDIANLAYNIGAVGGGVDVNVLKHVNARVEYEYQRWFGFPLNDIKPQLGTIGVAYHF